MKKRAVVLLSGGLDSAVTLFWAAGEGFECHCLAFHYGQRHEKEISASRRIAEAAGARLEVVKLDLPWKGSSLVDKDMDLPNRRSIEEIKSGGIPSSYVPARNTVFLSIAASFAETIGAQAIFIGAHSEDSSGYPDCRKEYLDAFNEVIKKGTKRGIEGKLKLEFPLIDKSKNGIISLGESLAVPFHMTWSCYSGEARPCEACDSCVLRAKGFREAGMKDPLLNEEVCLT